MNSKALEPQLKALKLIPETVQNGILQSMNKEKANAHLLQHIKEDADEETVMEIFRIASKKDSYGRMNTFAANVFGKLQQG